jgi:predicted AAA+ superfamily ATPase
MKTRRKAIMEEQIDFVIDKNNLYRDESITDLKMGGIRCFTPIMQDGTDDESRDTLFVGNAQVMSPQGIIPIRARIEAATLEEAMERFPEAMRLAMEDMIEQAEDMQAKRARQQQGDSTTTKPET